MPISKQQHDELLNSEKTRHAKAVAWLADELKQTQKRCGHEQFTKTIDGRHECKTCGWRW